MSLRTTVASLAATALMLSACGGESSDPDKSPSSASSALSTETAAGAAECASADLTRTASELGVDKLEPDIVGEAGADESCTFMSPGVEVVISADYLSAETDVAHEVDNEIGGREVSSSEPEFGGQPGHLIVNADEQAQMLLVTNSPMGECCAYAVRTQQDPLVTRPPSSKPRSRTSPPTWREPASRRRTPASRRRHRPCRHGCTRSVPHRPDDVLEWWRPASRRR